MCKETDRVDKKKFGIAIRNSRIDKKYTQRECAEECKVSMEAYQKWERGLSFPKEDKLEKICEFLKVDSNVATDENIKVENKYSKYYWQKSRA